MLFSCFRLKADPMYVSIWCLKIHDILSLIEMSELLGAVVFHGSVLWCG
jgi:hypothetical protein